MNDNAKNVESILARRKANLGEVAGEEVNTGAMKLVKTDVDLCDELHALLSAVEEKMQLMRGRGLEVNINFDNGDANALDKVQLLAFIVKKKIVNFLHPEPAARTNPRQ